MSKKLKQITLDDSLLGYACKCGKIFDTMSKLKIHYNKSHKMKREKIQINFVLENFGMICTKKTETSNMQNFSQLGRVY